MSIEQSGMPPEAIVTSNLPPNLSPEQDEEQIEEQKRQRALEAMASRGYIEYGEDGQIIADTEKINQYSSAPGSPHSSLVGRFYDFYGTSGYYTLQRVFHDQPVISKEDWEAGIRQPKPLFYDPSSDEAALDRQAIREANFYLVPNAINRKTDFPDLEQVSADEALMALFLIHPNYGDSFRDPKTNKLMVRDNEKHYRPIDYDYFKRIYHFNPNIDGRKRSRLADSPRRFLELKGTHLQEKGILVLDDFRKIHWDNEKMEPLSTKKIGENGFVFLDGINYYAGKKLPDETEAKVLGGGTVLIIAPDGKIISYFKLKPDLKTEENHLPVLRALETDSRPFNRDTFLQKKEDESDDDYRARIEAFNDFEFPSVETSKLPVKTKNKMKAISQYNWSQIDDPAFGAKVSQDFSDLLDRNEPSQFYSAEVNGNLIALVRFKDLSPTEVYAGSLNIDYRHAGAKVGESLLRDCIRQKSQTKIVRAAAYPSVLVTAKYIRPESIGGFGFVAKGVANYPGMEVPLFQMEIDRKHSDYQTNKLTLPDIVSRYRENEFDPNDEIIVLRFNPLTERTTMISACESLLNSGEHVMTNFIPDTQDKACRYLVFEKVGTQNTASEEADLPQAS